MKNIISLFYLILFVNISYASFPVSENVRAEFTENIEVLPYGNDQSSWGVLSFALSVAGIILLFTPAIGVGILLHLLAIIFGIIGFNRKLKGLAISGFLLSLVSLLVLILYISVVILSGGGMG